MRGASGATGAMRSIGGISDGGGGANGRSGGGGGPRVRSFGLTMMTDARGGGLGGAGLDCATPGMRPIAAIAATAKAQGRSFILANQAECRLSSNMVPAADKEKVAT